MPTLSPLYTDADLELCMGGAANLVQLAKAYDTSDPVYAAFKSRVRASSQQAVFRIMGVAFDPLDPVATESDAASTLCLSIAIWWAWFYGTGGQAIPPEVSAEKESALAALNAIRTGDSGMGTATAPANKSGARTVSIATDRSRVIRRNMGGFC